ncbi:MAG: hypothetical protein J1D77_02135 [Muribaculaceae bacterium]|nr:hypothetical protein [Muribaculaceae bacterium]
MNTINELAYWHNLIITYFIIGISWLFEHFRDYAWIVRVAAISLTVSGSLIVISLFRIFNRSLKRRKRIKVENNLRKRYGEAIEYILSPESDHNMGRDQMLEKLDIPPSEDDPKRLLKDWRERMAMARIIYRTRISEDARINDSRNVQVLLNIFGITEFLEEVVLKDKQHLKVEALLMLRAFKVSTNQWISNQLMNSKRHRVKRMAMYSSIMTHTNTDLQYFESEFFANNFCMYDEIQLGFVLQKRLSAKRKIPNLAHWATMHEDPKAQEMFIRMMRQFNQKEYCYELEELFNHSSEGALIEEIARTWGYLGYTEGEQLMSEMLLTQADDSKVAIMHALTRLNTGNSLPALVDGYRNSGSPHVKFEALRCIYLYGQQGRAKFEELRAKATDKDKFYFEFFDNELTLKEIPLEKTARYHSRYGDNLFSVA